MQLVRSRDSPPWLSDVAGAGLPRSVIEGFEFLKVVFHPERETIVELKDLCVKARFIAFFCIKKARFVERAWRD